MRDKIKVLFVDDRQSEFTRLREVFATESYFELINETAMFDEGSREVLEREVQKNKIKDLFENQKENFTVILFDLSLRNGKDEHFTLGNIENLLSVEIYNEMKEWLKSEGKIFVFVTSHQTLKGEKAIKRLKELLPDASFLRKSTDKKERFLICKGYDGNNESLCGDKFNNCISDVCFNKVLKRIVEQ